MFGFMVKEILPLHLAPLDEHRDRALSLRRAIGRRAVESEIVLNYLDETLCDYDRFVNKFLAVILDNIMPDFNSGILNR